MGKSGRKSLFSGTLWVRRSVFLVCLALLVAMPGCGGCRRATPQSETDAEKALAERNERLRKAKEKKPNFEFGFRLGDPEKDLPARSLLLAAQPHEAKPRRLLVKPGHWTVATLPAKANNFSLVGNLGTTVVDGRGDPMDLLQMPFTMTGTRPAALPKGQPKRFDMNLFVPANDQQPQALCRLSATRGTGTTLPLCNIIRMPEHQYHFVVLADSPGLYGYVKDLDAVRAPTGLQFTDLSNPLRNGYYQVWLIEPGRRLALPSHGLFWTSTACVLWDEANPDRLSLDQQLALLDWLHWGGQLIVSGPDTLDTLQNSFLGPYLPARPTGSGEIVEADVAELNAYWKPKQPGKAYVPLVPIRPWSSVTWEKHAHAREVPGTGGLLAERRVGRGRVVVSAFRLSQRELAAWPGRHGFFNGCLLGRPSRVFKSTGDLDIQVDWVGTGFGNRRLDSQLVSNLRYFTRDHGRAPTVTSSGVDPDGFDLMEGSRSYASGVGGWNDFSPAANAARTALTSAAQIEIPERTFVVWVVVAYLIVLVPLNWAMFRVIGRVEWAWVAAPLIALACTATVIHLARLDIGFARSMTEVAVVEMQGDYPRAHVTRYMAMYTSLATTYELRSDDPGVQMQPFPAGKEGADSAGTRFGRTELRYQYGKDAALDGLQIMSNFTGMAHTEQMLDLGGSLSLVRNALGHRQVANNTQYTIRDVGVVEKDQDGTLRTAWLGDLEPGSAASLNLGPAGESALGQTASQLGEEQLALQGLRQLVEDPADLIAGDVRLVGWTDSTLPGLEIRPAAPQARRAAIVLTHLRHGFGRTPRPDQNTRIQVEKK